MQTTEPIGVRVRAFRIGSGLTAQDVAARAGISPVTWSRIENGRIQPNSRTVEKIAHGLGISVADLYADNPVVEAVRDERADNLLTPQQRRWLALLNILPEERIPDAYAEVARLAAPPARRPRNAMNREEAAAELVPLVGALA